MDYTWDIAELQGLALRSLQFVYNVDGADTLSFELKPEKYGKLPLLPLDRLTVTEGERVVFSGLLPLGAACEEQAALGETVQLELQSDYYVLERTVYAKLNYSNEVVFSRSPAAGRTTNLAAVCNAIDGWLGGYLPSSLSCDVKAVVPTPHSNGTAPCASLLGDALRWVPDAVVVQRYSTSGNSLQVTTPAALGELRLNPGVDGLQSVALRARKDLQVPVCALVGGVHRVWPANADVRTLGAFVYAVPIVRDVDDEVQSGGAGNAPGSSKMIVRGVQLPEDVIFERGRDEYRTEELGGKTRAIQFIKEILPEYTDFIPYMAISPCLVSVVSKETLEEEIAESDDEDAKMPANYSDKPQSWSADGRAIYVHTEGSFAASSRSSRNVRGLKWCKATLSLVFSVRVVNPEIPDTLYARGKELFPGKRLINGVMFRYVRKTISCNLIDCRRKVYDPATNRLCSTDPDFNREEDTPPDDNPTIADYVAAMGRYYDAAKVLQHEGSVSMLLGDNMRPEELTGKLVRVDGMRDEWATMNAVVRSVSWDYQQRKLNLTLGPRSVMGFDEYLERRTIARLRGRDEAQRNALANDPKDDEAQQEQEREMSVSPSVSAKTDKGSTGRWHRPFKLYVNEDTDKVTLAGGTLQRGKLKFNVEDSERQIIAGEATGAAWSRNRKVLLKWYKKGDALTFDIYQKGESV